MIEPQQQCKHVTKLVPQLQVTKNFDRNIYKQSPREHAGGRGVRGCSEGDLYQVQNQPQESKEARDKELVLSAQSSRRVAFQEINCCEEHNVGQDRTLFIQY